MCMILQTVRNLLHIGFSAEYDCGTADIRDVMTSDRSMNHSISQ
jgi:hypothetical protein